MFIAFFIIATTTTDTDADPASCASEDPLPTFLSVAGWYMFGAGLVGTGIISHRAVADSNDIQDADNVDAADADATSSNSAAAADDDEEGCCTQCFKQCTDVLSQCMDNCCPGLIASGKKWMEVVKMSADKYVIFCAPALHFTDTMTDFAAAAEFWLISRSSGRADCGYVHCVHFTQFTTFDFDSCAVSL